MILEDEAITGPIVFSSGAAKIEVEARTVAL
jgi:hypothetical protein